MSFVLDNSVTMRWFFGAGAPRELAYARSVLDAMKTAAALVPVTWGLEVSNVIARAEARNIVTEARSEMFLEMLRGLDITADARRSRRQCPTPFILRAVTGSRPTMPRILNSRCGWGAAGDAG